MHLSIYIFLLFKLCTANAGANPCSQSDNVVHNDDYQARTIPSNTELYSSCNGSVNTLLDPPKVALVARMPPGRGPGRGRGRGRFLEGFLDEPRPPRSPRPPRPPRSGRPSRPAPEADIDFIPLPPEWPTNLRTFESGGSVHASKGFVQVGANGRDGWDYSFQNQGHPVQVSNLRGQAGLIISGVNPDGDEWSVAARFALNNRAPFRRAVEKAQSLAGPPEFVQVVILILPAIGPNGAISENVGAHIRNELAAFYQSRPQIEPLQLYPFNPITPQTRHVTLYDYRTTTEWTVLHRSEHVVPYVPPRAGFLARLANSLPCFFPQRVQPE